MRVKMTLKSLVLKNSFNILHRLEIREIFLEAETL